MMCVGTATARAAGARVASAATPGNGGAFARALLAPEDLLPAAVVERGRLPAVVRRAGASLDARVRLAFMVSIMRRMGRLVG